MIPRHRKTSPKVLGGKVQRKNNWELTTDWTQTEIDGLVFARERPGAGYRHYVRKKELERFVRLLPDWDELSMGLDAVPVASGEDSTQGWHAPGIVALYAWPRDLEEEWSAGSGSSHSSRSSPRLMSRSVSGVHSTSSAIVRSLRRVVRGSARRERPAGRHSHASQ